MGIRVINCLYPINLSQGLVPCGHCILCSNRKKREWVVRCVLQKRYSKYNYFITLTFDNEHLLDYSHRQIDLFFKLLRKKISFKYFGVFERGEKSFRPHFHLLLYCDNVLTQDVLQSVWKNGFVQISELTEEAVSYCCGYVQKKLVEQKKPDSVNWSEFGKINKFAKNDFELSLMLSDLLEKKVEYTKQTYYFMSKGLGFNFFMGNGKNIEKVINQDIKLNGVSRIVPRAFTNKIKKDLSELELEELSSFYESEVYQSMTDSEKLAYSDIITNHNIQKARDLEFFEK